MIIELLLLQPLDELLMVVMREGECFPLLQWTTPIGFYKNCLDASLTP